MFISLTRLRLRSPLYLLPFFWWNKHAIRQVRSAPGFLGGKLLLDAQRTFWTMTGWNGEEAMREFRIRNAWQSDAASDAMV